MSTQLSPECWPPDEIFRIANDPKVPTYVLQDVVREWDDRFIDLMAERERTPRWRWMKRRLLEHRAHIFNSAALHLAVHIVGRDDQ